MASMRITPSMRATAKYFWVVLALFLVQIFLGAMTAHYQVEGQQAYGFMVSDVLPYSITRTWHTQLAVLWIAVAWLGTGLYIAPAMSGHEPKFQRLGVNFLWTCLLIIVVGSFAGSVCGSSPRACVRAWCQPSRPMPAMRNNTLKADHTHNAGGGVLPSSGSLGQLLV